MREFQVSGSSVFWWVERSGILQNTGGREGGRGLVRRNRSHALAGFRPLRAAPGAARILMRILDLAG